MINRCGENNPNWKGGVSSKISYCRSCGITFNARKRRGSYQEFCSTACYGKSVRKEGNINWKGDGVGYSGLHVWLRRNVKKPATCQDCGRSTTYLDCANISQKYFRDLSDWLWLCRSCHMKKDGRLQKFLSLRLWGKI
jgi:hypothetical protein